MTDWKIDDSWTLFLDRDGVINKRKMDGYIDHIQNFVFLPSVFSGLKRISKQFNRIFIVTNQQGVGKGWITKKTVEDIHLKMLRDFQKEGIAIDKIYVAYNLKGAENDRRKPHPIMGLEAKNDFPTVDFTKAIMVGDTETDLQFGKNLGMKVVWIKNDEKIVTVPDLVVENFNELADELGL